VLRESLGQARRPVSSRRFVSAVREADGDVRVAVGGGHVTVPGWINTDISWRAGYYLDLCKPWPIPPGVVSRIYADNVIEHFTLEDGRQVLHFMLEALVPGGAVRLATPDVGRTARAYLDDPELAEQHLARHRAHGYRVHHPVDLLRVTFAESGHHLGYCFDYDALAQEMEAAGFIDVHREEAGESMDPPFVGLEARAEGTDRAMQLVVEGRKAS
jgi:predicted SAM-dependent methyltransferase